MPELPLPTDLVTNLVGPLIFWGIALALGGLVAARRRRGTTTIHRLFGLAPARYRMHTTDLGDATPSPLYVQGVGGVPDAHRRAHGGRRGARPPPSPGEPRGDPGIAAHDQRLEDDER